MKHSFSISCLDEIRPKDFGVSLKTCKTKIENILDILFDLPEIKKSKIFKQDISKVRFDVSFCTNKTIKEYNRIYRNKDAITDVITFSLFCDDENSLILRKTADLGQILISLERCDEQKQTTFEEELLTLITHGILHLLGFDHQTKKDYDFVVRIQKTVLGKPENE